jgi:N-acetylglucosamine-6-phosphate deacetylase
MIVLSGAHLVLPDRILSPGTLEIEGSTIVGVRAGAAGRRLDGHYIVPGFVDVHAHGVEGVDSLDGDGAIAAIAGRLPRYGVTAFCPTTVACAPGALRAVLDQVRACAAAPPRGARVLPAHLESNFVNPAYRGAQPAHCLRSPRAALDDAAASGGQARQAPHDDAGFEGGDILREIDRASAQVGIVTLAPELAGGLDLVRWLAERGFRVSLGHSAATYEEGLAAIAAGARHATHLFNRMSPLDRRAPGLPGAILQADEVAAELICDGIHVHPAMLRMAIAAKRPSRVVAITDATAASGLPPGGRALLGGQPITVGRTAATLDDGTLAGSLFTMDRVFRLLVETVGLTLVDAATVCSTTPAREMGLRDRGVLAAGSVADLVVLDAECVVGQTYIEGQPVYSRNRSAM